jgi:hypothetical protein
MEYSDRDLWTAIHTLAAAVEYLQLNGTKKKEHEALMNIHSVTTALGVTRRAAQALLTRWFRRIEKVLGIFSTYTQWTRQDASSFASKYQLTCLQQGKGDGADINKIVSARHRVCYAACKRIREFANNATDDVFYTRVVGRFREVDAILARLDK